MFVHCVIAENWELDVIRRPNSLDRAFWEAAITTPLPPSPTHPPTHTHTPTPPSLPWGPSTLTPSSQQRLFWSQTYHRYIESNLKQTSTHNRQALGLYDPFWPLLESKTVINSHMLKPKTCFFKHQNHQHEQKSSTRFISTKSASYSSLDIKTFPDVNSQSVYCSHYLKAWSLSHMVMIAVCKHLHKRGAVWSKDDD